MNVTKYVVKVDEGYFYKLESTNRIESKIVSSIQNATIYEFPNKINIEELENDIFVKWLYRDAANEGGSNPRLIKVIITEE
jgi:hypothetical protein